jgi:hypothetical protein
MSSRHKSRRRAVNKTGRNTYDRFIMIWHYMYEAPAYQSLKPITRAVLIELKRRFNGSNNGRISYSVRQMAARINCGKDAAGYAFHELIQKGFVRCTSPGGFNYKLRHASQWELTEEECNGKPATKEFMAWRPSEKENAGPETRTGSPKKRTHASANTANQSEPVRESGLPATIEQCSRSEKTDTCNIPVVDRE